MMKAWEYRAMLERRYDGPIPAAEKRKLWEMEVAEIEAANKLRELKAREKAARKTT